MKYYKIFQPLSLPLYNKINFPPVSTLFLFKNSLGLPLTSICLPIVPSRKPRYLLTCSKLFQPLSITQFQIYFHFLGIVYGSITLLRISISIRVLQRKTASRMCMHSYVSHNHISVSNRL